MPPVYRIIEVCIFALLNFLPFMLLALYPFRKNLRFSDVTPAILIVLLTIVQIWLGIWAAFFSHGNTGLISVASTALYAIFYFFTVKFPLRFQNIFLFQRQIYPFYLEIFWKML